MVMAETVGNDPSTADPAVGRLQSSDAARRGRATNGAPGVGARAHRRKSAATATADRRKPSRRIIVFQGARRGKRRPRTARHGRTPRSRPCRAELRQRLQLSAQTLSSTGTLSASSRDCAVVRTPTTSKMSFKPYGMPCSGPRGPDVMISASAFCASWRARSEVTVTKLSSGRRAPRCARDRPRSAPRATTVVRRSAQPLRGSSGNAGRQPSSQPVVGPNREGSKMCAGSSPRERDCGRSATNRRTCAYASTSSAS